MKKNFCISKMLGVGFLSMTTILGGAFLSMHDVFAAGGDGEGDGITGASQTDTQFPIGDFSRQTGQINNNVRHRPPRSISVNDLSDKGAAVKGAIYRFGTNHGFICGKKKSNKITFNKAFGIKVVETARRALGIKIPSRDERRVSILMYNNVATYHFDKFMRLMNTPAFEAYCMNVCKNDQVLLNTLGVTINDIH